MPRRAWMDLHADAAERLGRRLVTALSAPNTFIRRRVEAVELLSYELVRREVTVELALGAPATWRWEPLEPLSPLVVPVSVVRKQPLRHSALREGDDPVSALRAAETAALLVRGFESLAGRRATFPRIEALQRTILEVPEDDDVRLALELGVAGPLLGRLADVFALVAELPAQPAAATRVVGYRFDEPYHSAPGLRAGMRPTRYRLAMPGADLAASFHAEVILPQEARARRAQLEVVGGEVLHADPEADRPSLHAPRRLRAEDEAEVLVDVLTQRPVFYTPALTLAGVELLLLLAGAVGAFAGLSYQGAAVPLLFAAFAAITGLVVRADESPLVRTMLAGGRVALFAASGCVLLAAALVAAGASRGVLAAGWLALAVLALPAVAVLAVGWREASPGVERVAPPAHRPNPD